LKAVSLAGHLAENSAAYSAVNLVVSKAAMRAGCLAGLKVASMVGAKVAC